MFAASCINVLLNKVLLISHGHYDYELCLSYDLELICKVITYIYDIDVRRKMMTLESKVGNYGLKKKVNLSACLQVEAFSMIEGAKVLGMEMMSKRMQG